MKSIKFVSEIKTKTVWPEAGLRPNTYLEMEHTIESLENLQPIIKKEISSK